MNNDLTPSRSLCSSLTGLYGEDRFVFAMLTAERHNCMIHSDKGLSQTQTSVV